MDHDCIHEETFDYQKKLLERTNLILYGDGVPKNGLVFRFDKFMNDHETIVKDITEIKTSVLKAINDSAKTERMIEDFRSDEEQFEKGKQAILKLQSIEKKEKRDKIEMALKVITVIVAVVALYLTVNSAFNKVLDGQKAIKADTKVTNEVLIPSGAERGLKTIIIDSDTTSTFK